MVIETAKLNIESDMEALLWLRTWQGFQELFKKDRAELTELTDHILAKYPELEHKGKLYRVSHVTDEKLEDFVSRGKTSLNKLAAYSFSTSKEAIDEFLYYNTKKYSDVPIEKEAQGLDVNKAIQFLARRVYSDQMGTEPADKTDTYALLDTISKLYEEDEDLVEKMQDKYQPIGISNAVFRKRVFTSKDYDVENEIIVKGPIEITADDIMERKGKKAIVLSQPFMAKYKLSMQNVPMDNLKTVVPKAKPEPNKPQPKPSKSANNKVEWWKSQTKEFQKDYLEKHPRSKFKLAASLTPKHKAKLKDK